MSGLDAIAYPEWTEQRKKRGLDPLGMQNSSVNLYQRLIPGISNVTQRIRYYGFYAWLSASYAHQVGDTDPKIWQRFIRRAEALYALVAQHSGGEIGVAGTEWAQRTLDGASGEQIDFAADAEPGSATHYLKQAWGVYGAAYASQLFEVGVLSSVETHGVPVPSSQIGVELADAFAIAITPVVAEHFLSAVQRGTVGFQELDAFSVMLPSAIAEDSAEEGVYQRLLFATAGLTRETDRERARTLTLLLQLVDQLSATPSDRDIRWALYSGFRYDGSELVWLQDELALQRRKWWVYQANDLAHVCLESLLKHLLDALEPHRAGVPLKQLIEETVAQLLDSVDTSPSSWAEWLEQCRPAANAWSADDPIAEETLSQQLLGAAHDHAHCGTNKAWSALRLLAVLHNRANLMQEDIVQALGQFDPNAFRSLLTEVRFLDMHLYQDFATTVAALLEQRVLRRHLWVAMRKLRFQSDYTFLVDADDGLVRLRAKDGPVLTNPRLRPAITFLKDVHLVGDEGLTSRGRALMETL